MNGIDHLDGQDRPAVKAAADLLAESVHESIRGLVPYHATRYPNFIAAALTPPPAVRTVLIRTITHAGKPVAVADWRVLESELFLNGLAVHEDFRGQRYGTRLLEDGLSLARSLGLPQLALDVASANTRAIALYNSVGFTDSHTAYWFNLTNDQLGAPGDRARVLDWPLFQPQRDAYGFADVSVRDDAGSVSRIRIVGTAMRLPSDRPVALDLQAMQAILGTSRAYAIGTEAVGVAGKPFARFRRMRCTADRALVGF
jgi:ribosomal protein S18 acetylase RimI-like enzyme